MSHCFNIPIHQPFLSTLAQGILARWGHDPLALAKVEVLLPNRRSARAFAEILLKESGKPTLLLPRIHPIGDAEDDDISVPLSNPRRLLLISEKIAKHIKDLPRAAAFAWAEKLCALQDECERYGISLDTLRNFFPEDVAQHRETLLALLALSTEEKNTLEATRNQLLRRKSEALKTTTHPVIAAGSLGTIPATAELLRTIYHLPQGMVILPGFDPECGEVPPTHPQYNLQLLLKYLQIEGPSLRATSGSAAIQPLDRLPDWIAASAMPPRNDETMTIFCHQWMQADFIPQPITPPNALRLLQADTDFQEAEAIAVAMRETLETPEKTALLITPDRRLARQVSALLKQWDVTVDDSAGSALSHTPLGGLLLLILDAAFAPQSPLALLPLLKHPLCQFNRQEVRELELQFFRRQRKARGEFYEKIQTTLKPLAELLLLPHIILKQLLQIHINLLADFSGNPPRPESPQLEAALAELLAAAEGITITAAEYPGLFRQLFSHYTYRPAFGTHPRLSILSPIEARLMMADRVIIASLNDNAWPGKAAEDWLGKRLRTQLGLPQQAEAIGHAAHDFCQLLGAKEIILTRARYIQGTPQNPHPWLIRLQALCTPPTAPYLDWLASPLPQTTPLAAPAPCPPLAARPTSLSATDIRDLMQQPYRYYAKKILKLSPLEALRNDTADKDIGSALHRAFEAYVISMPWPEPQRALSKLLRDFIKPVLAHSSEWVLWQGRIPLIAAQFIAWDEAQRLHYPHVYVEQTGTAEMLVGQVISLHAKADRIALNDAGEAVITDYKTGSIPENKEITRGREPQLWIEKWILEKGGYNTVLSTSSAPHCAALQYWKIHSSETRAEITEAPVVKMEHLDTEIRGLLELFYLANLPFLAIPLDYRNNTDPYAHLIRMEEAFFR